jgi:hypothetical protein
VVLRQVPFGIDGGEGEIIVWPFNRAVRSLECRSFKDFFVVSRLRITFSVTADCGGGRTKGRINARAGAFLLVNLASAHLPGRC